jgi:hypothetical protein
MLQNIFVGALLVIVVAAGAFGWWIDNGSDKK